MSHLTTVLGVGGFSEFEPGPAGQLALCAAIGATVGALMPHPFTPSRIGRGAEGATVGVVFALAFVAGAGRLDGRPIDALPLAAAALGLLLYSGSLLALGRWRSRSGTPEGGAYDEPPPQ
jgi:hypothetical protein